MYIGHLSYILLIFILAIAVVTDIRFQRIPNWLTFSAMIAAVVQNTVTTGFSGFLFSAGGICVGIAVMIMPYLMGGMGAGDAKFMGAVGGMLGPKGVFVAFLLTALIGGIYAILVLAFYGGLRETFVRYRNMLKAFYLARKIRYIPPSEGERRPRLRYGVAIALGTITTVIMKNNIYEMLNLN